MSGFILLHRTLIGNPQFRGIEDEYAAIWLIARAAWEPMVKRIAGQMVSLERGQVCDAISGLARAWECSKSTAHARLRHFEKNDFIRTEVRTGLTLITVCNYDDYQLSPNEDRTHGKTIAERSPNDSRTSKINTNQSNEGNEDGRTRSNRGTRLPADWRPDEGDYRCGRELGLTDAEIGAGLAEFHDYWKGIAGQRGTKLDWNATFRNRLRQTSARIIAARNTHAAGGKSAPAGVAAAVRKVGIAGENRGPDDKRVRF